MELLQIFPPIHSLMEKSYLVVLSPIHHHINHHVCYKKKSNRSELPVLEIKMEPDKLAEEAYGTIQKFTLSTPSAMYC